MTDEDRRRVLAYARRAVEAAVLHGVPDPAPPRDGVLGRPGGLFVTLRRRSDGALRGCIGRLHAEGPLGETIAGTAHSSAREDPRFDPVRPEELTGLSVEVSILGEFRASPDPLLDLAVGTHGLRIRLGERTGILLPQVATEQGWDAPAFLDGVCRKAGLPPGAWRDPEARVEVFTAEVIAEEV